MGMNREAVAVRDLSVCSIVAGFLSALFNVAGSFLIVPRATRLAAPGRPGWLEWVLSKVPRPFLQALLDRALLPFVVTAAGAFASSPPLAGCEVFLAPAPCRWRARGRRPS